MSILNRITTIIRANVNDALEQAENPEVMLNQILRDMYDGIKEAREQVVEAVAQQKLQERDLAQAQELSARWRRNAELALEKGDEDLARECLRRKRDYDANAVALQHMLDAQRPVAQKLKSELGLLESRYAELLRNREGLLARYRTAQAQERMQEAVAKTASSVSIYDPSGQIQQMERKIREKEAKVAARSELTEGVTENRLRIIQGQVDDPEIEAELLQLKASSGQGQLGPGETQ